MRSPGVLPLGVPSDFSSFSVTRRSIHGCRTAAAAGISTDDKAAESSNNRSQGARHVTAISRKESKFMKSLKRQSMLGRVRRSVVTTVAVALGFLAVHAVMLAQSGSADRWV